MSTAKVVQIGSEGERAFARVKPLLDVLRDHIKKAAAIVSKEYGQLPKSEKPVFAAKIKDEYGWSQDRLGRFALIGREFPAKKKLISTTAPTAKIDDLDLTSMYIISGIDNKVLKAAATAGVFDAPITTRALELMRKTGALPTELVKRVLTELQKLREHMQVAAKQLDQFSISMDRITRIMHDEEITNAKGQASTALVAAFERACTQMASVNPATSKRAFAILRGVA